MTKDRKEKMLDEAKRLFNHIDKYLQKEHAIEWFGKNAVTLRNARENMEFVILCLDKLEVKEIKENEKH